MVDQQLKVVREKVDAAAGDFSRLGPRLRRVRSAMSAARNAAAETEADAALEKLCERLSAGAGKTADAVDGFAKSVSRAAECYRLADEYAVPKMPRGI